MINSHTDISKNLWIYRFLPVSLHGYIQLARLDRPIGFLLLYIPSLWGASLALTTADTIETSSFFLDIIVLMFGSLLARAMGCVWNDIADRKLDALVERTKYRPLPSGRISLLQAYLFLGLLSAMSIAILTLIPLQALLLLPVIGVFVAIYPYSKRITFWPQIILGITFNASIFVGWCMVGSHQPFLQIITQPALWTAYIATILWTVGYDTIYAYQDIRDDEQAQIKSSARYFQFQKTPVVLIITSSMIVLASLAYIESALLYLPFTLIPAFLYQGYILYSWQPKSPQSSLLAFKQQAIYGFLVVIAVLFAIYVGIKT